MEKLKKTAAATKRVKSSTLSKNGASRKPANSRLRVGANGSATAKSRRVEPLPRPRTIHVTEKATASEIYKALGVKPKTVERVRQIIRELEEKNWKLD